LRYKNLFIFIFFIPSAWAELDTTSQAFQNDLNKVLNFQTCRLRGNESNKDINFIENLKLKTSMNTAMIEDVVSSITIRASSNSLNCYLRVNLTVLLAQSLDRLGYYFEAVDLYNKILTYKGLDNDFKMSINRLISQAKSKKILKQQTYQQSIPEPKIKLAQQDISRETQEKVNNEKINKLTKKITTLENEITNFNIKAASSNNEITELNNSFNKALDDFAEQELYIKELGSDLLDYELSDPGDNKDKIYKQISDQLILFENQNSYLSSSNKELQKSNDNLQKQILDIRKQIDDIETKLNKIGDSNKTLQSSSNKLLPFYIIIAFLLGTLLSVIYKNDITLKIKQAMNRKDKVKSKEIKEISDFEDLEIALDSLLLLKDFEFNENGNFLFGYINGVVEDFTDNSIAASLEKDKLLERYFKQPLINVEKYFRFNSNIKIYEKALLAGKEDAQSFKNDNNLIKIEDYLNNIF
jgi:hypothetical protein